MEVWGGCQAANAGVATPGLDLWLYSRPCGHALAGGDVHFVSVCGAGTVTRLILADVAGHGACVAELACSLHGLMRRNINRKRHDRLLRALNRDFGLLAEEGQFATALVATYLTSNDTLTVSNAGHPRPLWYQAQTGHWSIVSGCVRAADNLPWGVSGSATYSQRQLSLGRGDLLLFYTDALTETCDGFGRQLGEAGLLELVQRLDATSPAALADELVTQLNSFRNGEALQDDLTFILLHHNAGPRARLSVAQKLRVLAKVCHLQS